MTKPLGQKFLLLFRVAHEAEALALGHQTVLIGRAVGIVAGHAVSNGYRTMHLFFNCLIIHVAFEADLTGRVSLETVPKG